ncbi:hypothetical protein [Oceanobacillus oncorhynchi]|uniref:hypothetical protein n=1 Tax=Oceanobacillus oncorhynchi TaxID=545501 RepID=UPI0034D7BA57
MSNRVTKHELDERFQIVLKNLNISNIHLIHLHQIPVQYYQIRYFTFFPNWINNSLQNIGESH